MVLDLTPTQDQVAAAVLRRQRAQKVAEIVGQRMKLKADSVGGERTARQPRPLDRAFPLLNPLLARARLL